MANSIIATIRKDYATAMQQLATEKGNFAVQTQGDADGNPAFYSLRLPGARIIPLQTGYFQLVIKRDVAGKQLQELGQGIFVAPGERSRNMHFSNEAILGRWNAKEDLLQQRNKYYFKQSLLAEVIDWVFEVQESLLPQEEVTTTDISKFVRGIGEVKTEPKRKLTTKLNKA